MNRGKGKLFGKISCLWILVFCLLLCHHVWAQLPHPFDLSTLDGTNGVRFEGIDAQDLSGLLVSGAGDVNGDGLSDFLIGALRSDLGGNSEAGESYLVYGSATRIGSGGVLDLAALDGENGVRLEGIDAYDFSGGSVSGAGDVNGDGFADLLIGACVPDPGWQDDDGEAYLVFGSARGIGSGGVFDLSTLNGTNGVCFEGIDPNDKSGARVSGVGDVNGDGFADILITAELADPGGDIDAGESYVVYGTDSEIGSDGVLQLSLLDGLIGVRLDGIDAGDWSGRSASGADDINGDGFDDLLVGAPLADPGGRTDAGEAYLVYGSAAGIGTGGVFELATLNGTSGVRIEGISADDWVSDVTGLSGVGDTNGDGFPDVFIGALAANPGGITWAGETYLIYGTSSGIGTGGVLQLSTLNGINGVRLSGIDAYDQSGQSVSGVGDVNGDGLSDLLIGAPGPMLPDVRTGEAYLIFGTSSEIGSGGVLDLSALNGTNGIRLDGVDPGDRCGRCVAGVGDVNGDGYTDLLIGALAADPGGVLSAGETYLVFGSGTAAPGFRATVRPGDRPRIGIGMIGDGSHFIPLSRVWVDFNAGDDGSGGPSLTTVNFHRVPVSSFAPLEVDPLYEWEISTNRVNYGTAAVTFKGTGERGETDWQGLILKSTDGGATWFLPGGQQRNSILHEVTLPAETLPARYALVQVPDISAPRVVDAVYNDDDDDGVVEAGESVTLIMSHGVIVRPAQLSQASFYLAVSGDSLGGAGFTVASNTFNTRLLTITLGANASITIAGQFSISNTGAGQPSGIDIATGIAPSAIQSLYGVPAVDGGVPGINDSGVDILYTLVTNSGTIGPAGGTVQVTYSPNAAYTKHSITIPAGALPQSLLQAEPLVSGSADVTFTLQPPPVNLGMIGAVQIVASDPSTTFSLSATLTIEYRESDVDVEMGQTGAAMRVHQLVENPLGVFNWVQLPGNHIVDTQANTVRVQITNLNPMGSVGSKGIFGNLVGETIEECSYNIAPGGGGAKAVLSFSVPITGGPDSIYELHRIEILGYELTTPTDPDRIEVTISSARLIDRISTVGGNSFPESSHAIFVIKTHDSYGRPIAFNAPVNMYIEFLDGALAGFDAFNDVVNFAGERKEAWMMRLVKDVIDGAMVDFQFVEGVSQWVNEMPGGGTAVASGVRNMTGPSGKGVWGAVAKDFPTAARNWELYQ